MRYEKSEQQKSQENHSLTPLLQSQQLWNNLQGTFDLLVFVTPSTSRGWFADAPVKEGAGSARRSIERERLFFRGIHNTATSYVAPGSMAGNT